MKEFDYILLIVGIPKSGTTWLLSIFKEHPECIALTAEMVGIPAPVPTMETCLFTRNQHRTLTSPQRLNCLEKLYKLHKGKLLVEKTPKNILVARYIRKLLKGKVKFVLIKRNPYDVIYSMLKPGQYWHSHPKGLRTAIAHHRRYNIDISPDYTIQYEALWNNPIAEVDKMFSHFDLSTSETETIINRTKRGNSLPMELKRVFDVGTPGQGAANFTDVQMSNMKVWLL